MSRSERFSLIPRHAAALLATGWYLLMPPAGGGSQAILTNWTIVHSYDSAKECEEARKQLPQQEAEKVRAFETLPPSPKPEWAASSRWMAPKESAQILRMMISPEEALRLLATTPTTASGVAEPSSPPPPPGGKAEILWSIPPNDRVAIYRGLASTCVASDDPRLKFPIQMHVP